jgi:hypothetical protein
MNEGILKHISGHKSIIKFLLILSVLVGYFLFLSWKYDIVTGGIVSALTWSFFVLCTPVADAGILLDFPFRLITGLKMVYSELMVWLLALSINVYTFFFHESYYDKTVITHVFYKILSNPWPYWGLIALCAVGTFLSVWFGDQVMDHVRRKSKSKGHLKARLVKAGMIILLYGTILVIYYNLIKTLGIDFNEIG